MRPALVQSLPLAGPLPRQVAGLSVPERVGPRQRWTEQPEDRPVLHARRGVPDIVQQVGLLQWDGHGGTGGRRGGHH